MNMYMSRLSLFQVRKDPENLQPSRSKANEKDGPETIYCLNIEHDSEGHNRDEENQVIDDSGSGMDKTRVT